MSICIVHNPQQTSHVLIRSLVIWDHTVLPLSQRIAGTHLSTPEG